MELAGAPLTKHGCGSLSLFRSPDESPSISPTKNPESTWQQGPVSGVAQWSATTHEAGLRSSIVTEEVSEIQEAGGMAAQQPAGEQQSCPGAPMVINGMKLDGAEGLPGIIVLFRNIPCYFEI
jgi:hypothetical protein